MSDTDLSELDVRVLAALREGFPVSQSPYCDVAARLGASEVDVLNSAEKLRQVGAIARIAGVFTDFEQFAAQSSAEDADLAQLVAFDVPWSEHPYAELAAQLEMRGTSLTEAEVIARLGGWIAEGTMSGIFALSE